MVLLYESNSNDFIIKSIKKGFIIGNYLKWFYYTKVIQMIFLSKETLERILLEESIRNGFIIRKLFK